jgi:hypothetical protein
MIPKVGLRSAVEDLLYTVYPMFRADEGLAWLEMHEALRPEDAVIAVNH